MAPIADDGTFIIAFFPARERQQRRCDSEIISLLNQKLAGFLLNQRAPAARSLGGGGYNSIKAFDRFLS